MLPTQSQFLLSLRGLGGVHIHSGNRVALCAEYFHKRAANAFAVSGEDVSPFSARLCRAHANCYENLPIFASLVLVAVTSGNAAITAPLALWAVAARIGQSTVHLLSTSVVAVQLRFLFFLALWSIQAWLAVRLLGALL